ncbi:hypothetical protein [Streptomyces chrestomyceticus]|uniref:C1q domain-containing protein n=1 Tax=Streptomyces chrestomyceticus TaxID=68185 RepID=A0ABU7WLV5_9ACTN
MTAPPLPTWAEREVLTAAKLNTSVRAPYAYLADMPRVACRGYAPGQSLAPGAKSFLRWGAVTANAFTSDAAAQWVTALETGLYVVNAHLTVRPSTVQPSGDGVMLFVQTRAPSGAQTNVVTVREIAQQSQTLQTITACSIVHLTAGTSIGVAAYLDSGAKPYTVQEAGALGGLTAFMAAPTGAYGGPSAQLVDAPTWADGEHLDAAVMTRRITQPLSRLYSPPRFACRAMAPYSAASGQRRTLPWKAGGAFEQSGGWTTDGTTFTAPASGLYWVSLCAATMRTGPEGAYGSYQMNLMRNGELTSLHQRQVTRTDYQASIAATDLTYLNAGDRLSVEFLGTGTGLTWRAPSDDDSTHWGTISAVMLSASATSMEA